VVPVVSENVDHKIADLKPLPDRIRPANTGSNSWNNRMIWIVQQIEDENRVTISDRSGGIVETKTNQIKTDDLAFSAYMKMKGHKLIKSDRQKSKYIFSFEIESKNCESLKVEFINSDFLKFYNELRNLKKLF
jgi:hypothetical protein